MSPMNHEIFRHRLAELNRCSPSFRIFTAEELDRATDSYSESLIIGPGSNSDSIVYKAQLHDHHHHLIVAIKKWRYFSDLHIEQFTKELSILSNLPSSDKQIVRILGAGCDETPAPVVVYEYMPNGTLHRHIHDLRGSLSWEARLRIAAMTAEALACLHSAIPNPQFHRGVKAKDVMLDEGMEPKVSDYGGRLMMVGCFTFLRIKDGREGYYNDCMGSSVSGDVYGFGVVMAELLTGELAMSEDGVELGKWFVEGVREGRLVEMLEGRVREEAAGGKGELVVVEKVAEVARRCLVVRGEERLGMREVADELRVLMRRQEENRVAGESGAAEA